MKTTMYNTTIIDGHPIYIGEKIRNSKLPFCMVFVASIDKGKTVCAERMPKEVGYKFGIASHDDWYCNRWPHNNDEPHVCTNIHGLVKAIWTQHEPLPQISQEKIPEILAQIKTNLREL